MHKILNAKKTIFAVTKAKVARIYTWSIIITLNITVMNTKDDFWVKKELNDNELQNVRGSEIDCSAFKHEFACEKQRGCVWSTKNFTCHKSYQI